MIKPGKHSIKWKTQIVIDFPFGELVNFAFLRAYQTWFAMNKKTACYFVLLIVMTRCATNPQQDVIIMEQDPHSYAQPGKAAVTHLDWKANVDFDSKTISAVAKWDIDVTVDADIIFFDTKDLLIEKVIVDDRPLTFKLADKDEILGQALAVPINQDSKQITIEYRTSPGAEALQWLSPQQTAGKKHPFLFTQSQAILARSWIPCQDSPAIRFTYYAEVTVPSELLALMSASNPQEKNNNGVYKFRMRQPISSYLLALAVGDLRFKEISNRSGVYAESPVVDKAAREFSDLEKMIAGAEDLYGKYQWDRYDLLVLPPSFPFGGMENPRLTFATPTILAGDRSLTSLVAHELAHSWSGNLVTNATWDDFWLNEGFTVYFETRIMEKLYGRDYAEMLAALNLQDLKDEIKSLNEAGLSADTRLELNLKGRNPDDGVTDIAYNKGYFFLRSIEEKFGRDQFDEFLKNYFSKNAFTSMDTEQFIRYIKNYYQNKFKITLDDQLFQQWVFSEGLPADCPQPVSNRFKAVDGVIAGWKAEKQLKKDVASKWSTHEWLHFLKNLPDTLTQQQMKELDAFGNFTNSGNAEIITAWGVLSIRNNYAPMNSKIEAFLINTGRRKFLSPLYNELVKTEAGKVRAKAIYETARPNYHFVATNTFDKLLERRDTVSTDNQ
jgi:leukotriene-A4 hydrolase